MPSPATLKKLYPVQECPFMEKIESRDLLRRLTLAGGPPGAEGPVRDVVRKMLGEVGIIEFDRLGSIICKKEGSAESPRIQLDSHLDEVGFLVQGITRGGMLSFVSLGSWWEHVLLAQRVEILTEKGSVPGIIGSKPPHFLSSQERKQVVPLDKLYIDVGASSAEEVAELGVRVGDPVVPRTEFQPMANPRVLSSKAFDNRVGVALMIEALRCLGDDHPNTVFGVGSVQEEVGCRGAGTAASLIEPDAALVLEGTPADDLPGNVEAQQQAAMGKGPQLRFFDPSAISNRNFARLVEKIASGEGIPLQLAVRRSGGTDARAISVHGRGVPTVVVGVPARYIHTHVSLIHLDDYQAAMRLILAVLRRLDGRAVERLVTF